MDMNVSLAGLFALGLFAMALMFAFAAACEKV
jgi:hypothetical protein